MTAMVEERLYIVTYDICDDRRWRRVYDLMHGYGMVEQTARALASCKT
jgi:hypothetical protein